MINYKKKKKNWYWKKEKIITAELKKEVLVMIGLAEIPVKIITLVYQCRFLWREWHEVKQIVPYNKKAYYVWEKDSNNKLKLIAEDIKNEVEMGLKKKN